jgi:hypothetical protein
MQQLLAQALLVTSLAKLVYQSAAEVPQALLEASGPSQLLHQLPLQLLHGHCPSEQHHCSAQSLACWHSWAAPSEQT